MNTSENRGIGALKKRGFRLLFCAVGLMAVLFVAGCSIASKDISLTDISVDDNGQVTATVTLSNIDLNNFKSKGDNTLRTIDVYYAYTAEKKAALKGYAGKDPYEDQSFNYLPSDK